MKCSNCGTQIHSGDHFCRNCGFAVQMQAGSESESLDSSDDQGMTFSGQSSVSSENTITHPFDELDKADSSEKKDDVTKSETSKKGKEGFFRKISNIINDEEAEIETREIDDKKIQKDLLEKAKLSKETEKGHKKIESAATSFEKKSRNKYKKKWIIALIVIALIACLAVFAFFFIYTSKVERFTTDDAKQLVKTELDVLSSGQYDEKDAVNANVNKEALNRRDKYIDTMSEDIVNLLEEHKFSVSDEQKKRVSDIIDQALKEANYTVDGASQVSDDNFAVTVQVKPVELYEGLDQKFIRELAARLVKEREEIAKDRELLYSAVLDGMMDQIMDVSLKETKYKGTESIAVKVQKKDDQWIINQNDIKKVEDHLIDTSGFLQNAS